MEVFNLRTLKILLIFSLIFFLSQKGVAGKKIYFNLALDSTWSEKEKRDFQEFLPKACQFLENLYGGISSPLFILIKKWEKKGFLVLKKKNAKEITLFASRSPKEDPGSFIHEISHLFIASYQKIFNDFWAEGWAESASAIYMKKEKNLEPIPILGLNTPKLATLKRFEENECLREIRYRAVLQTWLSFHKKDPQFFKKFVQALSKVKAKPDLVKIGEKVSPGFKKWYESQKIFSKNPPEGRQLLLTISIEPQKLTIVGYYFERKKDGREIPLINKRIDLLIKSEKESFYHKTSLFTDSEGMIKIKMGKAKNVKEKLKIKATTRDGIKDFIEYNPKESLLKLSFLFIIKLFHKYTNYTNHTNMKNEEPNLPKAKL